MNCMRSAWWVVWCGLWCACAPKAPELDAGIDAGLTAQQFCDDIRDQCAFEARCGPWTSKESCDEYMALTRADLRPPCERFATALAWGRMRFDQRAAEHCLAARDACDYGESVRSCDDVFLGAVDAGGDCYAHSECRAGFYCAADGTCPGHCTPKKSVGATAYDPEECPYGLLYDYYSVCRTVGLAGELCINVTYGVERPCNTELYCDGLTKRCLRYKKEGAPCGYAEDFNECEPGLQCLRYQLDAGWSCERPAALGAPCAGGATYLASCERGLSCSYGGTCVPLPGLGERCTSGGDCDYSLYCDGDGYCAELLSEGTPCVYDWSCAAGLTCRDVYLPDGGRAYDHRCRPPVPAPPYGEACPFTAP